MVSAVDVSRGFAEIVIIWVFININKFSMPPMLPIRVSHNPTLFGVTQHQQTMVYAWMPKHLSASDATAYSIIITIIVSITDRRSFVGRSHKENLVFTP